MRNAKCAGTSPRVMVEWQSRRSFDVASESRSGQDHKLTRPWPICVIKRALPEALAPRNESDLKRPFRFWSSNVQSRNVQSSLCTSATRGCTFKDPGIDPTKAATPEMLAGFVLVGARVGRHTWACWGRRNREMCVCICSHYKQGDVHLRPWLRGCDPVHLIFGKYT
jgi:hypothetical protein